jgi:hypothetical protein
MSGDGRLVAASEGDAAPARLNAENLQRHNETADAEVTDRQPDEVPQDLEAVKSPSSSARYLPESSVRSCEVDIDMPVDHALRHIKAAKGFSPNKAIDTNTFGQLMHHYIMYMPFCPVGLQNLNVEECEDFTALVFDTMGAALAQRIHLIIDRIQSCIRC